MPKRDGIILEDDAKSEVGNKVVIDINADKTGKLEESKAEEKLDSNYDAIQSTAQVPNFKSSLEHFLKNPLIPEALRRKQNFLELHAAKFRLSAWSKYQEDVKRVPALPSEKKENVKEKRQTALEKKDHVKTKKQTALEKEIIDLNQRTDYVPRKRQRKKS